MENENKLSSLLDMVYELEGLIHITLNRENPPHVLASLIENKVNSIVALTPEALASIPTEEIAVVTSDVPPLPSPSVTSEEISDNEPIPMEIVSPDYDFGDEYSDSADFGASPDTTANAEPAPEEEYVIASNRKERSKPAFNLNDRYRFRRSLFNGNDDEYQSALSMAAKFDSLIEAEDYFYNQQGWNRDNEEVKAFMELLDNYYK